MADKVFNFKRDCNNIFRHISKPKQNNGCMPFRTGALIKSMRCVFDGDNECLIIIDGNYMEGKRPINYAHALNDGSVPHNIPNAFGKPAPFGLSGRFDGKFHPGSKKHIGFFDGNNTDSVLGYALNYFERNYGVTVERKLH